LPRSPQWTDLHEILHGGSPRRHNHLFQILCRSVEGFWICAGSNFAILHWLSRSPLTQGCATALLWSCSVLLKVQEYRDWHYLNEPCGLDIYIFTLWLMYNIICIKLNCLLTYLQYLASAAQISCLQWMLEQNYILSVVYYPGKKSSFEVKIEADSNDITDDKPTIESRG